MAVWALEDIQQHPKPARGGQQGTDSEGLNEVLEGVELGQFARGEWAVVVVHFGMVK